MIAVVCSPAQRQFGQVACTHNDAIKLIGLVHKDLSALSGLGILVGDIVELRILTDVLKVLSDAFSDVYLCQSGAVSLCQLAGVGVGAVCGAEAGHSYSLDAVPVKTQHIECVSRHDKSEG